MKKLSFLFILAIITISLSAQQKVPVKFRFYAVKNKTITITKSMHVICVVVDVPEAARRDVLISGDTLTVGGIPSAPMHIKPGKAYRFGGLDEIQINKLVINAQDSAFITIIPARKDE